MKLNRVKHLIALFIGLQLISPAFAQTADFNPTNLAQELKLNSQKAYAACVRIVNLNATQQAIGGYFSGVVVDADGHILTAAHAVKPDHLYLVSFPDGRQFKAKGLGVIHSVDAAMMVITEKGKWPYAKMGYSSSLEPTAPCMSISYPGALSTDQPTLRFGYVAELKHKTGFLRSTCLMEPGDSGGALFDLKGRVIGIHSRVSLNLDENLEVPIDNFRKFWDALNVAKVHNAFVPESKFRMSKSYKQQVAIPQLVNLIDSHKEQASKFTTNVFAVSDSVNVVALSTLVNLEGLVAETMLKGKSYFISKSSIVLANPKIDLKDGRVVTAMVIGRDEPNDLVLLRIDEEQMGGVKINIPAIHYGFEQLGSFLISPKPTSSAYISVLGNVGIRIPKSPERYLGIGVNFNNDNNQILVTGLFPFPTEKQDVKIDDIAIYDGLKKINDHAILTVYDLSQELSKYEPGQSVNLEYTKTGGGDYTKTIKLAQRYVNSNSQKDLFLAGKSLRRDNFNEVLVHDARVSPSECGGPVFDMQGNFYGVNIARLSRTSSLILPPAYISSAISNMLKSK